MRIFVCGFLSVYRVESAVYFSYHKVGKEDLLWKLDHQLNLFARNAKWLREKEASGLSVRIRSTNRDRVKIIHSWQQRIRDAYFLLYHLDRWWEQVGENALTAKIRSSVEKPCHRAPNWNRICLNQKGRQCGLGFFAVCGCSGILLNPLFMAKDKSHCAFSGPDTGDPEDRSN